MPGVRGPGRRWAHGCSQRAAEAEASLGPSGRPLQGSGRTATHPRQASRAPHRPRSISVRGSTPRICERGGACGRRSFFSLCGRSGMCGGPGWPVMIGIRRGRLARNADISVDGEDILTACVPSVRVSSRARVSVGCRGLLFSVIFSLICLRSNWIGLPLARSRIRYLFIKTWSAQVVGSVTDSYILQACLEHASLELEHGCSTRTDPGADRSSTAASWRLLATPPARRAWWRAGQDHETTLSTGRSRAGQDHKASLSAGWNY